MRKVIYALAYICAIAVGVGLLVFNQQSIEDYQPVLRPILICAGILFIIPGIYFLLSSLRTQKDVNGNPVARPWFSTITGAIALIWGIIMLCFPTGLLGNLNITFGVSLIIVAIAQVVWIIRGIRTNGAPFWLYILPLVVIAAGVFVILLPKDYQNPGKEIIEGCVITGIALIVWAINGFMSLPRRRKTAADLEKESRRLAKDQEKVAKNEAKEAKERLEQAKANTEEARRNEEAAQKAADELAKKQAENAKSSQSEVKAEKETHAETKSDKESAPK